MCFEAHRVQTPFTVPFPGGRSGAAIEVDAMGVLPDALGLLGLAQRPTVVLIGGAGGVDPADSEALEPLFTDTLAPLVQELGAQVVDGGTDAGVMRLVGAARTARQLDFPLVGVAATGNIAVPGSRAGRGETPLEPNHSHFVLVPGNAWGDESPWLARVATLLAGEFRSLTLLVNGGDVSWKDAAQSVASERPIVVVAGSGRTADAVVAHLFGVASDDRARSLASSGLLVATESADRNGSVETTLRRLLETEV